MKTITRTARRGHRCEICKAAISAGDAYQYKRITPWDHEENDHFFSYRAHEKCHQLWLLVADQYDYMFPAEALSPDQLDVIQQL